MKNKTPIDMRSRMLRMCPKLGISQNGFEKICSHFKNIPEEQREAEAERVISLLKTMSEKEILENL